MALDGEVGRRRSDLETNMETNPADETRGTRVPPDETALGAAVTTPSTHSNCSSMHGGPGRDNGPSVAVTKLAQVNPQPA